MTDAGRPEIPVEIKPPPRKKGPMDFILGGGWRGGMVTQRGGEDTKREQELEAGNLDVPAYMRRRGKNLQGRGKPDEASETP